jgi:transcriptional regulator GlxA family with amidase domain
MKNRTKYYASLTLTSIGIFLLAGLFTACSPIREFSRWQSYVGANDFDYEPPKFETTKKTVVIVADNEGTEIFDLMAPFYLFKATEKANVYVVAEKKYPIITRKGLFLLPHFSFAEFDAANIQPDVIVIPNLSAMDAKHQNPTILNWIKKYYSASIDVLAVCDGSLTAAATGIFDGKPITAHATDFAGIKKQFDKPLWVNNVSVVQSKNLFSTAGVSSAVEGSLTVIADLFGNETMMKVKENINYPHPLPKMEHQSVAVNFNDKLTIGNKVTFKRNRKVGVLLQNGANEFELAAILDTYNRTFPKSIETFTTVGKKITTKYGLTLLPTGDVQKTKLDELHVINPATFSNDEGKFFGKIETVKYNNLQKQYIIDHCLDRIKSQYGGNFQRVVKLLLDYN